MRWPWLSARKSRENQSETKTERGRRPIHYIYKEPDRLLNHYNLIQLLAKGVADNPFQANIVDDGVGDDDEVINQVLELLPLRAPLGEDRLELTVVSPRHGRHHDDGPGSALMGPVAGDLRDAAGDVPQARGDGAPLRIHRVYGNSGSVQEVLNLGLQV